MGVAQQRILAERKNWRKDKPFGFFARPEVQDDGCDCSEGLNFEGALDSLLQLAACRSDNIFRWKCQIPGKEGTDWDGGYFPLTLEFTEDYPSKPPKVCIGWDIWTSSSCTETEADLPVCAGQCKFPPKFYHPNIYPSGTVCLSILNEVGQSRPMHSTRLEQASACSPCS